MITLATGGSVWSWRSLPRRGLVVALLASARGLVAAVLVSAGGLVAAVFASAGGLVAAVFASAGGLVVAEPPSSLQAVQPGGAPA